MDESRQRAMATERFQMTILGVFAAIGLLLAAAGVYGLIAYSVAQRTREFGIRMALGATRQRILASVIREGFGLALAGVVAGHGRGLLCDARPAHLRLAGQHSRSGDVRRRRAAAPGRVLRGEHRAGDARRAAGSGRRAARVIPLPIDALVPDILAVIRERRALVLTAAPGRGQDDARAAGACRGRSGHRAAAAPRRRAVDRPAHCRRTRLDARPRSRLARPLRAAVRGRDTRVLLATEGHPDRAPAAGPAALRLPHRSSSTSSTSAASTPTSGSRWRGRPGARATTCGSS